MSDFNVDWSKIASPQNGQQIAMGGDAEFTATFYVGKVPNFDESDYTEVPHLRLQAPGSGTVYDQPVRLESFPGRPSDPERFPAAWTAFQNGQNFDGHGTPLASWDELSPADIRKLEISGVRTVEQLASVSDRHVDGLGFGGRIMRGKAQMFVTGRVAVDPEKLELREQVSKLTDIVNQLLERSTTPEEQAADNSPPAPTARRAREPAGA